MLNVQSISLRESSISVTELLTPAHKVYELQGRWPEQRVFLFVADKAAKSYYLYWVPEDFRLPPGIEATPIPARRRTLWNQKVLSPDQKYYYIVESLSPAELRLYSAHNDRLLKKMTFDATPKIIGWTFDSSGVIFFSSSGFLDFRRHPIYKLTVP